MASYESMPLEGRAAIVKDLSLIAFTCGIWAAPWMFVGDLSLIVFACGIWAAPPA